LKSGYGKKTISKNISELSHSKTKRPHKQIVAIALAKARDSAKKAGKPGKGPKRKSKSKK
jgi:hypothetical protein